MARRCIFCMQMGIRLNVTSRCLHIYKINIMSLG